MFLLAEVAVDDDAELVPLLVAVLELVIVPLDVELAVPAEELDPVEAVDAAVDAADAQVTALGTVTPCVLQKFTAKSTAAC